jgi:hypothetical protein
MMLEERKIGIGIEVEGTACLLRTYGREVAFTNKLEMRTGNSFAQGSDGLVPNA